MSNSEEQLRAMYLSGTVSIPPRFPDLANIRFASPGGGLKLVVATHRLSPKVVLTRTFFWKDVKSIFLPDPAAIDFDTGEWLEGRSLKKFVKRHLDDEDAVFEGIIYVRENAQSMLEVSAGMTAAESAEYYPPLPDDRSVNHYSMDLEGSGFRVGCGVGP